MSAAVYNLPALTPGEASIGPYKFADRMCGG